MGEKKANIPDGAGQVGEQVDAVDAGGAVAEAREPLTPRERGFIAVIIVALVAAVVGFGLYFQVAQPSDAAAKVDDSYITEDEVDEYIEQYLLSLGIEDDEYLESYLTTYGMTPSDLRKYAVDQLAMDMIVEDMAEELGLTATEEEVEEQLEAAKESYAFGDDDVWEETLDSYSLTEDDLREQYGINLAENAICEAMVEVPDEASDDDILAYMQSYLAETTQKHAYRIVFSGDDMEEQAEACEAEIEALEESGELDLESFSALALEYSTEATVEETGGSYAWSGGSMSDECKEALEYVDVGSCSEVESIASEGTEEIYFCDAEYTFPSSEELTEIPDDIPDELLEEVEASTVEEVWDDECDAYLQQLLGQAEITYYAMPQDAFYNIYADDSDDSDDADGDEDGSEGSDSEDSDEVDAEGSGDGSDDDAGSEDNPGSGE